MKKIFLKFMVIFGVGLSVGLVSEAAQAIRVYVDQPGYYNYGNYGYRHGSHCRWVGGGWYRGYWHQARYVCYGGGSSCRWVSGYCRHGYCYPARRVCY